MREIKFRAWDKKNKKLYPVAPIGDYKLVDGMVHISDGYIDAFWVDNEVLEFMQYTGLKDKNGKEIYEGEIVQVEGAIPAEVYWSDFGYQLRNGDKTGGALANFDDYQIEVIGNIYENPELLNN